MTIDALFDSSEKDIDKCRAEHKRYCSKYWNYFDQATLSKDDRTRDFHLVAKVIYTKIITNQYSRKSQYLPEVMEHLIYERSYRPVNPELDEILQSEYWRYPPAPPRRLAYKKYVIRKKLLVGSLPTILEQP